MTNKKLGWHLYMRLARAYPDAKSIVQLKADMIGSAYGRASRKRLFRVLKSFEDMQLIRMVRVRGRPGEYAAMLIPLSERQFREKQESQLNHDFVFKLFRMLRGKV